MDLVVYLVHEVQRFQDLLVSHQRRSVMAVVVVLVGVGRRGRGVLVVVDLHVDFIHGPMSDVPDIDCPNPPLPAWSLDGDCTTGLSSGGVPPSWESSHGGKDWVSALSGGGGGGGLVSSSGGGTEEGWGGDDDRGRGPP